MKYPYSYYLNESGEVVVDKNEEHPDIQYLGDLNENKNMVEGIWEMGLEIKNIDFERYEQVVETGSFKLKKVI